MSRASNACHTIMGERSLIVGLPVLDAEDDEFSLSSDTTDELPHEVAIGVPVVVPTAIRAPSVLEALHLRVIDSISALILRSLPCALAVLRMPLSAVMYVNFALGFLLFSLVSLLEVRSADAAKGLQSAAPFRVQGV